MDIIKKNKSNTWARSKEAVVELRRGKINEVVGVTAETDIWFGEVEEYEDEQA